MVAVDLLRELLRLRTVNPPGNEAAAAALLEAHLSDAGLETKTMVSPHGRASLTARLNGPRDRPALVLLSHSDVVPVEEENWTHDPFGGELADGHIWGRGALDMKSVAVMHAVAVSELARSGREPSREVIVVVVADEETGGGQGTRWLVDNHAAYVGFGNDRPPPEVLGEGAYGLSGMLARPLVLIALGEKTAVFFDVIAKGDPGHGAVPPQHQAPVNLANLIRDIAGFGRPRVHPVMREQFAVLSEATSGAVAGIFRALASPAGGAVARAIAPRLRKGGVLGLLLSDSVTPTQVAAGYKANVVPAEGRASFDSRLLPDTDIDAFLSALVSKAARRQGAVANIDKKGHGPVSGKGSLFEVLKRGSSSLAPDAALAVTLSPGITDLRFFRARGASAYGWCPLVLSPDLLATIHGQDERIGVEEFERGVAIMSEVVSLAAT